MGMRGGSCGGRLDGSERVPGPSHSPATLHTITPMYLVINVKCCHRIFHFLVMKIA